MTRPERLPAQFLILWADCRRPPVAPSPSSQAPAPAGPGRGAHHSLGRPSDIPGPVAGRGGRARGSNGDEPAAPRGELGRAGTRWMVDTDVVEYVIADSMAREPLGFRGSLWFDQAPTFERRLGQLPDEFPGGPIDHVPCCFPQYRQWCSVRNPRGHRGLRSDGDRGVRGKSDPDRSHDGIAAVRDGPGDVHA